jgi:hypothetical protein
MRYGKVQCGNNDEKENEMKGIKKHWIIAFNIG